MLSASLNPIVMTLTSVVSEPILSLTEIDVPVSDKLAFILLIVRSNVSFISEPAPSLTVKAKLSVVLAFNSAPV